MSKKRLGEPAKEYRGVSHGAVIRGRIALILLLLLCAPMMTGFEVLGVDMGLGIDDFTFGVGLKNTDKDNPLVDLSEVISLGGSFVPGDEYISSESDQSDQSDTADPDSQTSAGQNIKPEPATAKKHKLTVTGRTFIFDDGIKFTLDTGKKIIDNPSIMYRLNVFDEENSELTLDTEYAELYAYMELVDIINDLRIPTAK